MLERLTIFLFPLLLFTLVGCGAGTPPTPTATPPPTATPHPTATATATAIPPTLTPAPTITLVAPSSFDGSPLQAYIAATDADLCAGTVPREFTVNAERATELDVKVACLQRLTGRETAAGEQQRTLVQRDTCDLQPRGDITPHRIRISEIWALDDLAQGYVIVADALAAEGETDLAREAYQVILDHYTCAWMFDIETETYTSAVAAAEAGLAALDSED